MVITTIYDKRILDSKIGESLRMLRTCLFKTKPNESAARLAESLQSGTLKPKNVYLLGDRWVVKYFFAGKQRTFGFFSCHEYDSAYRLADLIIHRFHSLRTRAAKLTEESYNLCPSQVEADLANEPEINSLLIQIHSLAPEKAERGHVARKTARQEFLKMQQSLDRIEEQLAKFDALLEKRSCQPAPGCANLPA